ncbi:hypothetical protein EST38_g10607 [Candolleomyces aberdarensis]|uniref:T6SS Phospholipase effector Tle1-like catalytic domain-containing protein n=1 Tax=Candolleomyces aberdarensis TaxID=2316362 RepID=A0A4Q2D8J8_9AGAR|nr:hypothetical protein EST38_g10607 [Candolleomyces aberdarensis]
MSPVEGRRLICCFDGTGNEFGENSNVVELFRALTKDKPDEQLVYYQTGIGTYTSPLIATPIASRVATIADQAVAWYLPEHVKDGYTFLMQNYRPNDRIYLFGFSRGAYTARALAGMLHKVGLLPQFNNEQVPFAYKIFNRSDKVGWELSEKFKKTFTAHEVRIEFVGVWDTVSSVGIIPRQLPFTSSNFAIKTFRHALSLDERRCKFLPNTWNTPTAREAALGFQPSGGPVQKENGDWQYEPPEDEATDVLEVWFTGTHADVGGGMTAEQVRLSRISLAWMIKECQKTNSGILFDDAAIEGLGIDPKTFKLLRGKAAETSLSFDTNDDHNQWGYWGAKMFDQLIAAPAWWLLEVIPLIHTYYHQGQKKRYISRNFGRGRYMYPPIEGTIKVHRSVKHRIEGWKDGTTYGPKIQNFDEILEHIEWVE